MSPKSSRRQQVGWGSGPTSHDATAPRAVRSISLLILVFVVLVVALMMVVDFVEFVVEPDPEVRAGPMYVTLTLTTIAALLMLIVALNASFLPFMSRQRARDVQLVMFAMAVTGVVTGLLTVGGSANSFVMRLVIGGIALVFIIMQNTRLEQARRAVAAGRVGEAAGRAGAPARQPQPRTPAPQPQPHAKSRQRRGGRKK